MEGCGRVTEVYLGESTRLLIDNEEEEERDEEEVEISSLFHLVLSLMFGSTARKDADQNQDGRRRRF